MYGQQAMFLNLLVIGGGWSASAAAAAAVATTPPQWGLQLESEDNTADLRVTTLLLPVVPPSPSKLGPDIPKDHKTT